MAILRPDISPGILLINPSHLRSPAALQRSLPNFTLIPIMLEARGREDRRLDGFSNRESQRRAFVDVGPQEVRGPSRRFGKLTVPHRGPRPLARSTHGCPSKIGPTTQAGKSKKVDLAEGVGCANFRCQTHPGRPSEPVYNVTAAKDLGGIAKSTSSTTLADTALRLLICSNRASDIRVIQVSARPPQLETTALYTRVAVNTAPRHQESAGSAGRQADEANAARLTKAAGAAPDRSLEVADVFRAHGWRGAKPTLATWASPSRTHVGDRDLSHCRARRPRRALRGLRARARRLQLLPRTATAEGQAAAAQPWLEHREAGLLRVPY